MIKWRSNQILHADYHDDEDPDYDNNDNIDSQIQCYNIFGIAPYNVYGTMLTMISYLICCELD